MEVDFWLGKKCISLPSKRQEGPWLWVEMDMFEVLKTFSDHNP